MHDHCNQTSHRSGCYRNRGRFAHEQGWKVVYSTRRYLGRTSNGTGPANELTLEELQQLDVGSWFDKTYRNERIPSLIEVAQLCRGKIDLLLDLKEQGEGYDRQVADVICKHGEPSKTLIGVRSLAQAIRFRNLLPEAKQLGLIPTVDDIEVFAKAGSEYIRLWPKWLEEGDAPARRVKATGKLLHLNGGTGDMEEVIALLAFKPDSTGADDPKQLLATLKKIAGGMDSLD